jgi:pterin-4a-carbinolamine dehydratase
MKLLNFDHEAQGCVEKNLFKGKSLIQESLSLPIEASEISRWSVLKNPERLSRNFSFDDFRKMYDFLSDLLVYQEKMRHHAKITIDHLSVSIETYTKDLGVITELDRDLADYCDLVYKDVNYYYAADNVDNEKFQ